MEKWKKLIAFTYPHEAHLVKGYLESEGIATRIQDEMTVQVNNFYSNAIGGVKIFVKEEDYDTGNTLLKEGGFVLEGRKSEKAGIETCYIKGESEKQKCPYCGSENISKFREPSILSVLGVFIMYVFLPIFRSYYHCFDCHKNWKFKIKKE